MSLDSAQIVGLSPGRQSELEHCARQSDDTWAIGDIAAALARIRDSAGVGVPVIEHERAEIAAREAANPFARHRHDAASRIGRVDRSGGIDVTGKPAHRSGSTSGRGNRTHGVGIRNGTVGVTNEAAHEGNRRAVDGACRERLIHGRYRTGELIDDPDETAGLRIGRARARAGGDRTGRIREFDQRRAAAAANQSARAAPRRPSLSPLFHWHDRP